MNFIIYDLEATCWRGRPPHGVNEVIEIGAYKVNQLGEVLDVFNKFIKPTVNPILSDFCRQLTSISQSDVDKSKTFPHIIQEFQDWINVQEEDYNLCSWGKFEIQLLKNDCKLHKLEYDWLDNNINVKGQYHEIKGEHKLTGLKNTIKHEGMEFTGIHHRAISDAENLAKIFIKYIDMWKY
ncbi:MAG: exonuclease domain-containing protein [Saprospiraceae bacterium]|nr:exonuclease domain-containing protein [Saprospiraceae bacterium]